MNSLISMYVCICVSSIAERVSLITGHFGDDISTGLMTQPAVSKHWRTVSTISV